MLLLKPTNKLPEQAQR